MFARVHVFIRKSANGYNTLFPPHTLSAVAPIEAGIIRERLI